MHAGAAHHVPAVAIEIVISEIAGSQALRMFSCMDGRRTFMTSSRSFPSFSPPGNPSLHVVAHKLASLYSPDANLTIVSDEAIVNGLITALVSRIRRVAVAACNTVGSFIDVLVYHVRYSVKKLVNNELKSEIVNEVVEVAKNNIEKMLEEPSTTVKRERGRKSLCRRENAPGNLPEIASAHRGRVGRRCSPTLTGTTRRSSPRKKYAENLPEFSSPGPEIASLRSSRLGKMSRRN
ncbi:hypothetical protein KSP40_PGU014132 [Platanthera guangdongensis]|uniref:Uncharacterized protein n=1 Tax=Platanthera guangdongensis TaxID=2320717 RepID=A0ABR2N581_9ASPA